MDPFSAFVIFFGCIALFVLVGIGMAIFSALFGRRRWGYGMYRPRPLFPWFGWGVPFERRGFYEPRHHHHAEHHHHHHGGGFGGGHHGGHHGGGFGGGHHGGGFGGGHH